MIAYVANTTVQVSDQDRALDFYVNKLGFEKRADTRFVDGNRWLEVAPVGAASSLVLTQGRRTRDEQRPTQFAGIVFGTTDIQETYEDLRRRGVTFTESPTAQPGGMLQAQFVDHDGYGFVLVQP
jgi:lactoylglutathione lyase